MIQKIAENEMKLEKNFLIEAMKLLAVQWKSISNSDLDYRKKSTMLPY